MVRSFALWPHCRLGDLADSFFEMTVRFVTLRTTRSFSLPNIQDGGKLRRRWYLVVLGLIFSLLLLGVGI